ncbi:MAG: S41 family peptidase [Candidatus Paceibacterota bacterium]|jgi:carboxyl-terminal processing protease
MQSNFNNRFLYISLGIVFLAGAFLSGVYFGFENRPAVSKVTSIFGKEETSSAEVDFGPFWQTWNVLEQKFVGGNEEVSDQDKVWGAIEGLVKSYGDPYTVFMPPVEAKMFAEDIRGNFSGVGMEIGIKDEILTVIAPLKNTPAERAGLQSGDQIIKIDETATAGLSVDEAVRIIRGETGTVVKLTILKKGNEEPKEIKVTRAVITIPTIETALRADNIFVINLYNFSAVSPGLFRDALREFVESGSHKLILDLRGNPGGYLDAAIDMASFFLPAGKVVVREDFGGNRDEDVFRSKGYDVFNDSLRMVILVDEGSASASEILAGALSEHGVAKLVGEKTFGKGSVQEVISITPETSLKVTVARWLTPNGYNISKEGLNPDFPVERGEDLERDLQMEKAVELLK